MLNGKFFTGLPPGMIENRSPRPDRMKSQFFWPEENENTIATTSPRNRPKKSDNSEAINTEEIKPKDLFHKQLASKINFYDTVDTPTSNNYGHKSKYSNNDQPLNNSRSEIGDDEKSFYETKRNGFQQNAQKYETLHEEIIDERKSNKQPTEKHNRNSTKEVFIHIDRQPETMAVNTLIDKKKLVSNRNMSKSVENISKIERDIGKNLYNPEIENLIKNVNKVSIDQTEMEYTHEHSNLGKMHNRLIENGMMGHRQHSKLGKNIMPRINDQTIDLDLRYEPTQMIRNNNLVTGHFEKSYNYSTAIKQQSQDDKDDEAQRSSSCTPNKTATSMARGHQQNQQKQTIASPNTNEARARVHNNLKSNIFFNDC